MRTPFGWTLTWQTSLPVLGACCALWAVPAAALAAPEQIGGVSFDRLVVTLLAMASLAGMLARRGRRGARKPRLRLLNKPKKTPLSVLVPPGPAPRLIPSDSPKATRAQGTRAPMSHQLPAGATHIDYIAAFADSAEASKGGRVDYLLVSNDSEGEARDSEGESLDPHGRLDGSLRHTG
jgi:hypothetical protein